MLATSRASAASSGGSSPGRRWASIVLPDPGGPTMSRLWEPAAATRSARFARACHTANEYRLYALEGTLPRKPGLARVPNKGAAIEVEVWEIPIEGFGRFTQSVPRPFAIGNVVLENGETVKGFVCEPVAVMNAQDITQFGGWQAFLESAGKPVSE